MSSSYRLDQFRDPDGYVASIAAVLAGYPDDVVMAVTDPRTGIQRGCRWPPTVAEVVTACEVRMQDKARLNRLKNWGKREEPKMLEAPREERPTLDELHAKYGENWGLAPAEPAKPPVKAPTWDQIIARYQADPARLARLIKKADEYAEDRGDAPA